MKEKYRFNRRQGKSKNGYMLQLDRFYSNIIANCNMMVVFFGHRMRQWTHDNKYYHIRHHLLNGGSEKVFCIHSVEAATGRKEIVLDNTKKGLFQY